MPPYSGSAATVHTYTMSPGSTIMVPSTVRGTTGVTGDLWPGDASDTDFWFHDGALASSAVSGAVSPVTINGVSCAPGSSCTIPAGHLGLVTLQYIGAISGTGQFQTLPSLYDPITLVSATINTTAGPAGCSTYPTFLVWDIAKNAAVATLTSTGALNLNGATTSMTLNIPNIPAGDVLDLKVNPGPSGCTTNAQNPQVTLQYY